MAANCTAAAELSELLESSYNLPNAVCDIGRVQLDFKELQRILTRRGHHAGEVDAKAHYLLAGSGFNAEQVLSDIMSIHFPKSTDQYTSGAIAGGVESYLSTKKQENVFASIESLIADSSKNFETFLARRLNVDWKSRKDQIYQALGLPSSPTTGGPIPNLTPAAGEAKALRISWTKHRIGRIVLGEAAVATPSPSMELRITSFSKVVSDLDNAMARGVPFPISRDLSEVSARFDPTGSLQSQDAWDALGLLVQSHPYRFFAGMVQAPKASSEGVKLRQLITHSSREYLEFQYRAYIDGEINSHRQEARLGGVPSNINKVKAFVDIMFHRNDQWDERLEIINKTPIWAQLYFLVRSGCLSDALQVVNDRKDIFEYVETNFASFFRSYVESPNHTLSPRYEDLVHTDYNVLFRKGVVFDPFKQALYKIIGRCDLQHRSLPDVVTTTEDWLWLQLSLVRELSADTELRSDRYNLLDLQDFVRQTGAHNFDPTNLNPSKYFSGLALVGLYEEAVNCILEFNEFYAVHYAIALTYYGLLRPVNTIDAFVQNSGPMAHGAPNRTVDGKAQDETSFLVVSDDGTQFFNFAGAIGRYTRLFRQVNAETAVDYLVLLAMNGDIGKFHVELARECLQELVLETHKFSELLGDVTEAGNDLPGAIERRMSLIDISTKQEYSRVIVHECAAKADEDGRLLDAILLYHLAGEHDKVLVMVNHSLGQTLASIEPGQTILTAPADLSTVGFITSDDPVQLARNILRVLNENPVFLSEVKPEYRDTTVVLLLIADAMNALAEGEYETCLQKIEGTGLLVLAPEASVADIRDHAQQFSHYDESVARNIPTVLEMTLLCCIQTNKSITSAGSSAPSLVVSRTRKRAANCMVYAGLIQYRMPRHVYTKLTQLEATLSN